MTLFLFASATRRPAIRPRENLTAWTQLQWVVDELRRREVSWADIGEALGMSRQSAWERFS